MQSFLASDVLIQARVTPVVAAALKDNDVVADTVATKGFLAGFSWLDPSYVADQLGTRLSEGGKNRDPSEPPAPGLHGNGLVSVAIGETALQPDPAPNKVALGGDLTFNVKFTNQGENDEFDVKVTVDDPGPGKPIKARDGRHGRQQGGDRRRQHRAAGSRPPAARRRSPSRSSRSRARRRPTTTSATYNVALRWRA